jgi:hypothetical protein
MLGEILFALILLTLISPIGIFAQDPPAVVSFSPQGTVKQIRQVTARFSQPMVPLGDPRVNKSPFKIDCSVHGVARWIDSGTWSYDFDHDLPAGVSCSFTLSAGLKTLAGSAFTTRPRYVFNTGGPAVVEANPWMGSDEIDSRQAFILVLDAAPDEQSVLDHAEFAVDGMPQRIEASLITGADRDLLLKRFADFVNHRPVVIVQARQAFPDATAVRLIWGKGIRTQSGIATDQDQILNFKTRPAFEVNFRCERESPKAGCIPVTPMSLAFSASISIDTAKQIALVGPGGTRQAPDFGSDSNQTDVRVVKFSPPFQDSAQYRIELPDGMTDFDHRPLSNASRFPLTVMTDEFPPLAKFAARFGIIEAADPVVPVTVRNLEPELEGARLDVKGGSHATISSVRGLLDRIDATFWKIPAAANRHDSVFAGSESGAKSFEMPKPNGAKAFEVVGIPLDRPGLYIVQLKSARLGAVLLGKNVPMYVPTAALVTDLSVHFKQGRQNSLVWVTSLERARPVGGAKVSIADCNGTVLWSGTTDFRGIALVPRLDAIDHPPRCAQPETPPNSDFYTTQTIALRDLREGLLVTATSGDDFSFVHSSWRYGIESWRFNLPTEWQPLNFAAHTVLDRPLFRAGETVHMKHFIRARTLDGFSIAPAGGGFNRLRIQRTGAVENYEIPLRWNTAGIAESNWDIPKDAKLGEYSITLLRKNAKSSSAAGDSSEQSEDQLESAGFRVEEFRVPLMKAAVRMPPGPLVGVTQVAVDLSAEYLSGGAAKGLPITLRTQIDPNATVSFPDFDNFVFANGAVKEGTVSSESENGEVQNQGVKQLSAIVLGPTGGAQSTIANIPRSATPVDLHAEMEFRDPIGEVQTVANTATIWPAKWLVGIRTDDWASSPGQVRLRVAVVGDGGKPVANAPVTVDIFGRKRFSYRQRLVGGFYAYDNTVVTQRAGQLCAGATNDQGLLFCDAKPAISGEAVVQASVQDDAGNRSIANSDVYIPGPDRLWFAPRDEDRMDVLPEKPQYEPGEVARFQVRMPFAEATALVTVEREGVIAASVIHLSGHNPVITLPIRSYEPNVFVSVLAIRGRIDSIQPTGLLDLGKPAFRLGIAEIRVGWRANRLKVTVTPDRTVYRVRDRARVKITVRTSTGEAPPPGSQVAVAAVDQGLLELADNDTWKLLDAMMGRRPYEVDTSTAQMEVVGKRHYGLKALPPGGGGGRQITRELFDTLLLWKATVRLDANGDASVEVPLNDSLTSFRIVAIASAGSSLFGSGSTLIQSTQDLMILPGVSPIIRAGDSFDAQFTIRNASQKPFSAEVSARIEGLTLQPAPQQVDLAPGDGKILDWRVVAPSRVSQLKYLVSAAVANGPSDHLAVTQRVLNPVPVRTFQATLLRVDKPLSQPVMLPAGALAGEGDIQLALSPSLASGLDGVREWMRAYPYICLEQRVSRAVVLGDAGMWSAIVADLPDYLDSDGLLKFFPDMQQGSDVLTSYVMSIAHDAGLSIPQQTEGAMVKGLSAFIDGSVVRYGPVPTADLPLRKIAAIDTLARFGKANSSMLGSITIDPNLWPDLTMIQWWDILLRLSDVPDRARRLTEADQIMRARINWQGTGAHLSGPRMWWLMSDSESATAQLVLLLINHQLWRDDVPRLMQGAIRMQTRGSWSTTLANAWGTLAVEAFTHAFEAVHVGGITDASLDSVAHRIDWAKDPNGGSLSFAWPPKLADLQIDHIGAGQPWAEIRTRAAIPLKSPLFSGYRITKTFSPIEGAHADAWRSGNLVRVHLRIDAATDMTWVVVNDPIPAGASQLGSGLMRESALALSGENSAANSPDFISPAYTERSFDSFRAYYEFVPKGPFDVEYTIRLNQPGKFLLPATRVEALYEPETFGELPNAPFEVAP